MYQSLSEDVVSYGGCQFPTLGFVVDRYRQREDHVAEDFWKIAVHHKVEGEGQVDFLWERYRLFDGDVTERLLDMCVAAASPQATVTKVTAADRQRWRPVGLNTTELQMIASRKHRMDPQKCLTLAETLYNRQILSYPRTENDTFKPDMPLAELVQNQVPDTSLLSFSRFSVFCCSICSHAASPNALSVR
jgi:DNA topoisomerase-3